MVLLGGLRKYAREGIRMGYNIVDILDKLIIIEKKGYIIYHAISQMENVEEKIKVVARILADQEARHVQLYKKIKKITEKGDMPAIDFDIYDQASQLISGYTTPPSVHMVDIQQLIRFALDFEKQNLALVMRIQGLLVRGLGGEESVSYKVLTEIIKEEQKHIQDLEGFIH